MPDPAPLAADRLAALEEALASLRLASDPEALAAAVDALEDAVRALRRRVNSLVLLGAPQPPGRRPVAAGGLRKAAPHRRTAPPGATTAV